METDIAEFPTSMAAQTVADALKLQRYFLEGNEKSRPTYKVIKNVDKKAVYVIRGTRHFADGNTVTNALTWDSDELSRHSNGLMVSTQEAADRLPDYMRGHLSDGYHTFRELYEHRHALAMTLARLVPELSWKARKHHSGTSYEGFFLLHIKLNTGAISYHLPNHLWDDLEIEDWEVAPFERDGHTPEDVVERLMDYRPLQYLTEPRKTHFQDHTGRYIQVGDLIEIEQDSSDSKAIVMELPTTPKDHPTKQRHGKLVAVYVVSGDEIPLEKVSSDCEVLKTFDQVAETHEIRKRPQPGDSHAPLKLDA